MKIKILVPLCLLGINSLAQMKYDQYLPFYDSLGVPQYMKLIDTARFFNQKTLMPDSTIKMIDENEKIVGYYIFESKRKWVFKKINLRYKCSHPTPTFSMRFNFFYFLIRYTSIVLQFKADIYFQFGIRWKFS